MARNLDRLRVQRVIVHDVPQRLVAIPGDSVSLSEVESILDQQLKNFFQERISVSLSRAATDVVFDDSSSSPIRSLVAGCLADPSANFVAHSQAMATHLHACQKGISPPGLLVVALCDLRGTPSLAILKLERHSGLRASQTSIDGKRSFSLEHIRELMLTDRARVFKVGLFWHSTAEPEQLEGVVCDQQQGYLATKRVAAFFLNDFLGCQLATQADAMTRQFFVVAQEFINKGVGNPQVKARYHLALLAEMNRVVSTIDPRQFVETNLVANDRMAFERSLTDAGLTMTAFNKDTSLIDPILRRTEIDFENGIAVLGTSQAFEQYVTITDIGNDKTRLLVEGVVTNVKGKR